MISDVVLLIDVVPVNDYQDVLLCSAGKYMYI